MTPTASSFQKAILMRRLQLRRFQARMKHLMDNGGFSKFEELRQQFEHKMASRVSDVPEV